MEQHGVDHAEDGGRGADAEGEGDDRNRGESRALAQHAEAETKILREILQPIHFAHIPAPFVCSRSEEHTSELQSQSNLVCRLLLEKKKNNRIQRNHDTYNRETSPADRTHSPSAARNSAESSLSALSLQLVTGTFVSSRPYTAANAQ